MPDFQDLLRDMAKRPAIYVGRCSIFAMSHYIDGYCHALKDLGHIEMPLDGWMRWVELRFLISDPGWHWARILLHIYGSDQAALEALPELYPQFLTDRAAIGIDGIEAELDQRLLEKYGFPWHVPPSTSTRSTSDRGPQS